MLSFFRRTTKSKIGMFVGLFVLALIAFAFAAGDITGNQFSGSISRGDTVARAGGSKLSMNEFQDRVQRVYENARRANPGLQISEFFAQGGGQQVYDQLVAAMTLNEYARDQGMHISKRLVDAQIARVPAFQDAAGNFSQDLFRQLLARERITEQALRDDFRRELLEKQVLGPVGLEAKVPASMVLPYASLLLEARQGAIAAIPAMAFVDKKDPTEAQLAAYYKANADRFTIPEQRRVRYAIIDSDRFVQASQPTDAEIQAYYNQNKAQYGARENRSVEQLVLPTEAAAKAIADQVKAGKTLADAAKGAGLATSDLKDQSRAALTTLSSAAVADAAFAAGRGELVGPVRGSLGWVVLRVTAIDTVAARPLAAARDEIARTLRAQKEKRLLSEFTGKIEDAVADGATFEEVAKDNGLKLETSPLMLASGRQVEQVAAEPPADVVPLLPAVFAMSADDDAQLVPIVPDKRYALVAPGEIVAAAPPPLAKVHAAVVAQFKMNQGNAKAKALAEQIRAKVAKGEKLSAAIAAAGVPLPAPQTVSGRRADILRGDQRPPAEVAMLFAMAPKSIKTMPMGQDRGYFVIQLDAIKRGDAGKETELLAQVRDQLGQVAGEEYRLQFQHAAEKHLRVTRKPAAVAGARKALSANNSDVQ
ncbi:MAG: SurA N-terminal domain-containing protein [Sphingobium sp.]